MKNVKKIKDEDKFEIKENVIVNISQDFLRAAKNNCIINGYIYSEVNLLKIVDLDKIIKNFVFKVSFIKLDKKTILNIRRLVIVYLLNIDMVYLIKLKKNKNIVNSFVEKQIKKFGSLKDNKGYFFENSVVVLDRKIWKNDLQNF